MSCNEGTGAKTCRTIAKYRSSACDTTSKKGCMLAEFCKTECGLALPRKHVTLSHSCADGEFTAMILSDDERVPALTISRFFSETASSSASHPRLFCFMTGKLAFVSARARSRFSRSAAICSTWNPRTKERCSGAPFPLLWMLRCGHRLRHFSAAGLGWRQHTESRSGTVLHASGTSCSCCTSDTPYCPAGPVLPAAPLSCPPGAAATARCRRRRQPCRAMRGVASPAL